MFRKVIIFRLFEMIKKKRVRTASGFDLRVRSGTTTRAVTTIIGWDASNDYMR